MKSIITICIGLLIAGCATRGNLTWTPTSEEWATMTVAERNAWTTNEMRVRQNRDIAWQNYWNNYYNWNQAQIFGPRVPAGTPGPAISFPPRQDQSQEWQEKRARQEYYRNLGYPW